MYKMTDMTRDIHNAVQIHLAELHELLVRRKENERDIARTRWMLKGLAQALPPGKVQEELVRGIGLARRKPPGMTEAILGALKESPGRELSARSIRAALEGSGFDLSDYSQPLSTVSIALRRLASSKRIASVRRGRNVMYRYLFPKRSVKG